MKTNLPYGYSLARTYQKGRLTHEVIQCSIDPNAVGIRQEKSKDQNRSFYNLLKDAMAWYVEPGKIWDPADIAEISLGQSDEIHVVSSNRVVHAVLSYSITKDLDLDRAEKVNRRSQTHIQKGKCIIDIDGIIVNPLLRKMGIGKCMISEMIRAHNPLVIRGYTNSEIAATSRARILREYGYITYIGGQLLYYPHNYDFINANRIYLEYSNEKKDENVGGIYFRYAPFSKFRHPDRLKGKPSDMTFTEWQTCKIIFDEVEQLQIKHQGKLVQVPLISVLLS